jgi:ribose-phosphate pyrophosphokinase
MDLHAPAIEGFFDIPVDHLRAAGLLADRVEDLALDNAVVGSPDAGGVARAEDFSRRLGASDLFVVFKRRDTPDAVTPLHLVGNVKGRVAIIIDDIISTGESLITAIDSLLDEGAKEVHACAVHADFTEAVVNRLESSRLKSVLVTDTIPIHNNRRPDSKIEVCSTARTFADTINRIHRHESVSALFS